MRQSVKKWIKRAVIGAGCGAALLVLMVAGAWIWLTSDSAQPVIQSRINAAIPGHVSWKKMRISLLSGEIAVRGLALGQSPETPIAGFDTFFLHISPAALLRGQVVLPAVRLDAPWAELRQNDRGVLNIASVFQSPQPAPETAAPSAESNAPPSIRIGTVRLTNGRFTFHQEKAEPLTITAEGIELSGDQIALPLFRGNLELDLSRAAFRAGALETTIAPLHFSAELAEGNLEKIRLHARTGDTGVDLTGSIGGLFDTPAPDLHLSADIDLADWKMLHNLPQTHGTVSIDLHTTGHPAQPSADLKVSLGKGRIHGHPIHALEINGNLKEQKLSIDRLAVTTPYGNADLNAVVELGAVFPNGFLRPPLDLAQLAYRLNAHLADIQTDRFLPGSTGVSGQLSAQATVQGSGISLPRLTVRVTLEADARELLLPGMVSPAPKVNLSAEGRLNQGMAHLNALHLTIGSSDLTAGGRYRLDDMHTEAELNVRIPDLPDLLPRFGVTGVSGAAETAIQINGPATAPHVALSLTGTGLARDPARLGEIAMEATLSETGTLRITRCRIDNEDSHLALEGTLTPLQAGFKPHPDIPVDLALTLQPLVPRAFLPELPVAGSLRGDLTLAGSVRHPELRLDVTGEGLGYDQIRLGSAETRLNLAGGIARIESLTLHHPNADLSIQGEATVLTAAGKPLKDPDFDLKIRADAAALSGLHPGLTGELHLSGTAAGRPSAPRGRFDLTGKGLGYDGSRLGDLDAHLQMADGILSLRPVTIVNGASKIDLSGTVHLLSPRNEPNPDPRLDLTIAGDTIRLSDFTTAARGEISINATVAGSVRQPRGTASLDIKQPGAAGHGIDALALQVKADGRHAEIADLRVDLAPGAQITGGGAYQFSDGGFQFQLSGPDLPLKALPGIPEKTREDLSGQISLSASGEGNLAAPRISAEIHYSGLGIRDLLLPDARISAQLKDQSLHVTGNPGFSVDADYHLGSRDFTADILFEDTDLSPYLRLIASDALSGSISGTIRAEGNAARIQELAGNLDLTRLTLQREDTPLLRIPAFHATLASGVIEIGENRIVLLEKGALSLGGSGRLDGTLDLRADGTIPISVADPFVAPLSEMDGDLVVSARVTGPAARPEIEADLDLMNLKMTIVPLQQSLNGIGGRIALRPDRVTVDNLSAKLGDGSFTLSGSADLKQFQPVKMNLRVDARRLPVEIPDTANLLLNSTLRLRGDAEKSRLTGEVVLLEGLYYKDVSLNLMEMTEKKRGKLVEIPAETSQNPFLKAMALNILIKRREPLRIENNLAEMGLSPNIQIVGTAARPVISGRTQIDDGVITFQGRAFEIQQGIIDFVNPYKIEPTLEIRTEAEIREWVIYLVISGTPENLKFTLTSDPAEEHGDILSLIALGKTTRELMGESGSSSGSPAQMLANILADSLGNRLKDATGLDEVKLEFKDSERGDRTSDVKVTLGKDLSRRISVKYGAETRSGELIQKVTTEYKILEQLLLSAFQDTGGNFGGALQYRLEFR